MAAVTMTSTPSSGVSDSLRLGRATLRDVTPYPTERTECDADLSDNTNLFGAPPSALRELTRAAPDDISRYPGLHTRRLREALADYAGVGLDEIVTGCGSDDVIDSAVRAFAEPGEVLAYSDPTFTMIPVFARVNGLVPIPIPFAPSLDIDPEALLATEARIIYICSPNNPTGTLASPDAITQVIERAPGIVIVDEAYAEFSGGTLVTDAPRHTRLLVTRTLSKAFGMAGFRIGYGTGSAALVREIEKVRGPYKENAPGERAAACAVREDVEWMRACAMQAVENRERFTEALRANGFRPLPSSANFVLVPTADAPAVARIVRDHGFAVRPYSRLRGVGDAIRVTIGPWSVMSRVLEVLVSAREAAQRDADQGTEAERRQ